MTGLATPWPIGVICALPLEATTLAGRRLRPGESISLDERLILEVSGIGAARAARCAESLLSAGAGALLSWGVCAGLSPSLSPGTLLVADRVLGSDGCTHVCDMGLHAALRWRLAAVTEVATGTLAHSNEVLRSPAAKSALHADSGAVAADMESAIVAAVARDASVAFASVRAVADTAAIALPASVLAAVDDSGALRGGALLSALLQHPGEIVALLAVARCFGAARRTLRTAATPLREWASAGQ